jgi:hypothetical protein
MKRNEYIKRLEALYKLAVKNNNLGMALEILEKLVEAK